MCLMLLTLTAFISSALRTTIPVGTIGLALAYVMQLAGLFQWCTRQSVEVENLSTDQALHARTRQPPNPTGQSTFSCTAHPFWFFFGGVGRQ